MYMYIYIYTSGRKQNDSDNDCSQKKKPDFPGHSPKYFLQLARRAEVEVTIIYVLLHALVDGLYIFFFFFCFAFEVMYRVCTQQ